MKVFNFICLFILLLFSILSLGQNNIYKGPIKIDKYAGYANFQYDLIKKDTILTGAFEMKGSSFDAIPEDGINYFSFNGNYDGNVPDGNWQFQFGKFSSGNQSTLKNYSLQIKVNGKLQEVKVEVDKGRLIQKKLWEYNLDQSTITDTAFISNISHEKESLKGEFSLADQQTSLKGSISADGYANENWSANSIKSDTLFTLNFEKGWLREIKKQRTDTTKFLTVFDKNIKKSKTSTISSNYFNVLNLLQTLKKEPLLPTGIAALIKQNDINETITDSLLTKLGISTEHSRVKVLLPHYPINKQEKNQLIAIKKGVQHADSIFTSFRTNAELEVLKQTDDMVLFYIATADEIENRFIQPIKKLIGFQQENILEFLPRESIKNLIFKDSIDATFNVNLKDSSAIFTIEKIKQLDQSKKGLAGNQELLKIVVTELDSIKQKIDIKLEKNARKKELIALEKKLLSEHKMFNKLVDSLVKETEDPYKNMILSVKNYVDKEIKTYWKYENVAIKLVFTEKMLNCLKNMEKAVSLTADLPKRNQAITKEYTAEVWNVYTATMMKEITKKRIYNAYNDVVVPFFKDKFTYNMSCDNVTENIDLLNKTHMRMLELRNERTGPLERKVRKSTDAVEILKAFKILEE